MQNLSGIHKFSLALCLFAVLVAPARAQKTETVDGVRVVHNRGEGIWAKSPRISLEKIRALGDIEAESEGLQFVDVAPRFIKDLRDQSHGLMF